VGHSNILWKRSEIGTDGTFIKRYQVYGHSTFALVRNSVWNRKKTNWKQEEIFIVQSAFLQYVTFTVYIYSHFTIYGNVLQYMALFYRIWLCFTPYFLLFFVYKEKLCI